MRFKGWMFKWLWVCSLFLLVACGSKSSDVKEDATLKTAGKVVFLKNNIHVDEQGGRGGVTYHASYANYVDPPGAHFIIPVNSEVTITVSKGIKGRELLITNQSDGKQIHFEYNIKNMKMEFEEYINLITSPTPISTSGLSELDKKGIKEGKALVGMTKDGVRTALGYPAVHFTPNLEDNSWTFWRDRYRRMVVEFGSNGKVTNIR